MRTCAHCDGPLKEPVRDHARATVDGTRLDRSVWLAHLEVDPYCSTECARNAHGVPLEPSVPVILCLDCQRPLSKFANHDVARCTKCYRNERRKAYFDDPTVCKHCGVDRAEYTDGCFICGERRRVRERRLDQDFVERERRRQRDRLRALREKRVPAGQVAGSIEPPENGSPSGGHAPLEKNSERRAA